VNREVRIVALHVVGLTLAVAPAAVALAAEVLGVGKGGFGPLQALLVALSVFLAVPCLALRRRVERAFTGVSVAIVCARILFW